MQDKPDIAVMMMTYRSESDIRQSLDTLVAQTYQNFHLVYVDDCSPDKTFDIAQEYRDRFAHITMLRNDKNKGVIQNLHDTLRLIEREVPQAEYFIWACADDWWEPTFLEKTRNQLRANINAAVCQAWFDTLHIKTGVTTQHKLCTLRGSTYQEASQIFRVYESDVNPTYFNFTLHGLMRMSVLRDIYPDSIKDIAHSGSTEISGLVAMLLHGEINILPECLIHRREYGSFAANNPQDPLSKYYNNIVLRILATFSHLPRFFKMRGSKHSRGFVLLMWIHLFYFYGISATYYSLKTILRRALDKSASHRFK